MDSTVVAKSLYQSTEALAIKRETRFREYQKGRIPVVGDGLTEHSQHARRVPF